MRDDWTKIELGHISQIYNGNSINAKVKEEKYQTCKTGLNYIGTKDIGFDGVIEYENGIKIPFEEPKFKIAPKNCILVCSEGGSAGKKTAYTQENICFGNKLYAIVNKFSVFDGMYIYYYTRYQKFFKSFQNQMNGIIGGVSVKKFSNITIPLSPILEQKAIVLKIEQLFSELDNAIKNLKTAKEKLRIYRQAVLKKAFEGELTKEWREKQTNLPTADELLEHIKTEREEDYKKKLNEWEEAVKEWEENGKDGKKPTKPKKYKDFEKLTIKEITKLPNLPQNWIYDYLAYAGELGRGKSKHRPRNDPQLFGGDYPFIQTGEVKAANNNLITEFSKTYNEFGLAQSKLWSKGTLCITIAANIAETAFLGINACFPDSVVGYRPFKNVIDSKYIDYFFKFTKKKIEAYAPATAQKNINLTTLENLVIPYCSLKEQNQIVQEIESRLSVCDKIEETIETSLIKSEALRQSILKKAFEGKLLSEQELQDIKLHPEYESAQELLKRIKKERNK